MLFEEDQASTVVVVGRCNRCNFHQQECSSNARTIQIRNNSVLHKRVDTLSVRSACLKQPRLECLVVSMRRHNKRFLCLTVSLYKTNTLLSYHRYIVSCDLWVLECFVCQEVLFEITKDTSSKQLFG